jgi:hypothetical protein
MVGFTFVVCVGPNNFETVNPLLNMGVAIINKGSRCNFSSKPIAFLLLVI